MLIERRTRKKKIEDAFQSNGLNGKCDIIDLKFNKTMILTRKTDIPSTVHLFYWIFIIT